LRARSCDDGEQHILGLARQADVPDLYHRSAATMESPAAGVAFVSPEDFLEGWPTTMTSTNFTFEEDLREFLRDEALARRAENPKRPDGPPPRMLRLKAAAAYLGQTVFAMRGLIQRGELPYVQGGGATSPWTVDKTDLDQFIERRKLRVNL
jgi:hypothetical protein